MEADLMHPCGLFSQAYLGLIVVSLVLAISCLRRTNAMPKELPWVGRRSQVLFSRTRTWIQSYWNTRQWLAEGYNKYSKHGKTFVLPDFTGKPIVMVPHEKLKWFVDRSDNATSFEAAIFDLVVGDYNFPSSEILRHFYCTRVAQRFISQTLPNLAEPTLEELQTLFNNKFVGSGSEWSEVNIHDFTEKIVLGVASRVIVGPELAKDQDFLHAVESHEKDVVRVAMLDPFLSTWLRPVIGPYFLGLPNWWHFRQIRHVVLPLIHRRLKELDGDDVEKNTKPKDYISWHILRAKAEGKTAELNPEWIAKSFLPIMFGTVHGTQATLVNLLLNILASKPEEQVLETLRAEIEQVYRETGGVWDKQSLSQLHRTDSAIRESMRMDSLTAHVLYRKVAAEGGLSNNEEGWTAPKGTTIAVDAWNRHHDPSIYPQPDVYDAFRFSRPCEEFEIQHPDDRASEEYMRLKRVGIANASDTFLTFGLGKHACPGRFWVDMVLKMFIAHMLMNYDVVLLSSRPGNAIHGPYALPNTAASMRIRRKATCGPSLYLGD